MLNILYYLRTPVFIAFALLCIANSWADGLPVPDTYRIIYTPVPPAIDGLLEDALWSQATPTTDFVIHDSGKPSPAQTFVQLAYDDHYLYLAATCQDKDIYAQYTKNQESLFRRDDLIEIFIDPDGDGKNYLEVGFSAGAVHYSLLVPEVRDGRVEPEFVEIPDLAYKVDIHGSLNQPTDKDTRWTLEARIPLEFFKDSNKSQPLSNQTWRIGLFRIDYASHSKFNQASGYYAWQYLGQFGFHRPERFGYVTFGDTATTSLK